MRHRCHLFLDVDSADLYPCSIWGPTCDGLDCVNRNVSLPLLEVGSALYYLTWARIQFLRALDLNGFDKPAVLYFGLSARTPLFV